MSNSHLPVSVEGPATSSGAEEAYIPLNIPDSDDDDDDDNDYIPPAVWSKHHRDPILDFVLRSSDNILHRASSFVLKRES